ncbi:MAG TPA: hypothetical protein VIJ23_11290 [Mycobacterium sp.]
MCDDRLIIAVASAAVVGALVGSVLTVLAWRVPRGYPLLASARSTGDPGRTGPLGRRADFSRPLRYRRGEAS